MTSLTAANDRPADFAATTLPAENTAASNRLFDAAPLSVNTVLWNLSTPAERAQLLAQAEPTQLAQAAPTPTPAPTSEMCTVELRYNPVALGANHAFVVTTDRDSQSYFRGGPSAGGPSSGSSGALGSGSGGSSGGSSRSNSSDGSNSSNSSSPGSGRGGIDQNNGPWGPIVVDHGAYRPGTIDWNPDAVVQRVTTVPGNCDRLDRAFATTADAVERAVIPYNPLSTNSNATARTILEGGGITAPRPSEWVPGWNTQLPR
jgi:hypothetical protein